MTRLRTAAIAALITVMYLLLVGFVVAVPATFIGGDIGFSVGVLVATLITWRLFYLLTEAIDA